MSEGDSFKPQEKWPLRSPLDVYKAISPYTQGKRVCDLGCGKGDILAYLKANGYCSEIFGIELLANRLPEGRPYVKQGNYLTAPIPEADVYLLWAADESDHGGVWEDIGTLVNRLPHGSLMIDLTSHPEAHGRHRIRCEELGMEFVALKSYEYSEKEFLIPDWVPACLQSNEGTRNCAIYKLK